MNEKIEDEVRRYLHYLNYLDQPRELVILLIMARYRARRDKNFALADKIRTILWEECGIDTQKLDRSISGPSKAETNPYYKGSTIDARNNS